MESRSSEGILSKRLDVLSFHFLVRMGKSNAGTSNRQLLTGTINYRTSFGTAAKAVRLRVLQALYVAGVAYLSAKRAVFLQEFRLSGDESGGEQADIRTGF